MPRKVFPIVVLWLLACGQDSNGGDGGVDAGDTGANQPCNLQIELRGALEASLPDDLSTCVNLFGRTGGAKPGVSAHFVLSPDAYLDLSVDDVGRGDTGEGFPAQIQVGTADRTWSTPDCAVDLLEHELLTSNEFGERSRIVGEGQCSGPAMPENGDDVVTIGPFDFGLEITWDPR